MSYLLTTTSKGARSIITKFYRIDKDKEAKDQTQFIHLTNLLGIYQRYCMAHPTWYNLPQVFNIKIIVT